MRIEINGRGLTLTIKGQEVPLNPHEAIALQSSLGHALGELTKKKNMESEELRTIRLELKKSKQRLELQDLKGYLQVAIDLFATGYIDDGYAALANSADRVKPADYLALICDLDYDGWVHFDPACPKSSMLGICIVASLSEETHPINRLWQLGSFDPILVQATGMISPEDMPGALQSRIFALLAQEIHMPAGQFQMGSDEWDAWDFMRPEHCVELTKPFVSMRFPVTQYMYWLATGQNPSAFFGATRPVDSLTWKQACLFCNDYSVLQGLSPAYRLQNDESIVWLEGSTGYRLPTEAEWECMAKAWTEHPYPGSDNVEKVGWIASNSDSQTQIVGQLKANAAGFYDLCGNVWEWCWDWYDSQAYVDQANRVNPKGPNSGTLKVCRGGGYSSPKESASVGIRGRHVPTDTWSALGFRMVRTLA